MYLTIFHAVPNLNVPISNLRNVEAMLTNTSITVEWDSIECLSRRGLNISIAINIRTGSRLVAEVVVPDKGRYTRDTLQPSTMYSFQLFLAYQGTVGSVGTTLSITTRDPPGAFSFLRTYEHSLRFMIPCIVMLPSHCEMEVDAQWSLSWPRTVAGTVALSLCPLENTRGKSWVEWNENVH